jgi:hypothetical protein
MQAKEANVEARRLDAATERRINQEARLITQAVNVPKEFSPGHVGCRVDPHLGRPVWVSRSGRLRRPTLTEAQVVGVDLSIMHFEIDGRRDLPSQLADRLRDFAADLIASAKRLERTDRGGRSRGPQVPDRRGPD